MSSNLLITKGDGTKEPFNAVKLRNSLIKSGASEQTADQIIAHVEREIQKDSTTSELYKHAFFLLHKLEKRAAFNYSLRRAIMALGPTGFPFEKYVAHIFRERGFSTLTGQMVQGGCVEHEVDIVAWNDAKLIMAEVKFHNEVGLKTDLKVALYVKARFDDLREETFFYDKRRPLDEGWLITNTKFTTTAIAYGMCKGITMIGWNFPDKGNLRDMIADGNLHPITCLTTLTHGQMAQVLSRGMVLCKELVGHHDLLREIGLSEEAAYTVMEEIKDFS